MERVNEEKLHWDDENDADMQVEREYRETYCERACKQSNLEDVAYKGTIGIG